MDIVCKVINKKHSKAIKTRKKLFLGLDIKHHIGLFLSKYKIKLNLYFSQFLTKI